MEQNWYNFTYVLHSYLSSGRAFKVRLQSGQANRLSELMKTAITAGFDWVYYEDNSFIHISVVPDGRLILWISIIHCLGSGVSIRNPGWVLGQNGVQGRSASQGAFLYLYPGRVAKTPK